MNETLHDIGVMMEIQDKSLRVDKNTHRALKMLSVERERPIRSLIAEIVDRYKNSQLKDYGRNDTVNRDS